jgi:hypothetical protein
VPKQKPDLLIADTVNNKRPIDYLVDAKVDAEEELAMGFVTVAQREAWYAARDAAFAAGLAEPAVADFVAAAPAPDDELIVDCVAKIDKCLELAAAKLGVTAHALVHVGVDGALADAAAARAAAAAADDAAAAAAAAARAREDAAAAAAALAASAQRAAAQRDAAEAEKVRAAAHRAAAAEAFARETARACAAAGAAAGAGAGAAADAAPAGAAVAYAPRAAPRAFTAAEHASVVALAAAYALVLLAAWLARTRLWDAVL